VVTGDQSNILPDTVPQVMSVSVQFYFSFWWSSKLYFYSKVRFFRYIEMFKSLNIRFASNASWSSRNSACRQLIRSTIVSIQDTCVHWKHKNMVDILTKIICNFWHFTFVYFSLLLAWILEFYRRGGSWGCFKAPGNEKVRNFSDANISAECNPVYQTGAFQ
jgi:hypothetical protein